MQILYFMTSERTLQGKNILRLAGYLVYAGFDSMQRRSHNVILVFSAVFPVYEKKPHSSVADTEVAPILNRPTANKASIPT